MTVNTEIIEDDIAQIRQRMEQRFDRLNQDLQPSQLMQGFLGNGSSSANENATLLLDKVKANPIAAAAVGVGLAGLFFAKQSSSNGFVSDAVKSDPAQSVGDHLSDLNSSSKEASQQLQSGLKAAKSKIGDVTAAAKRKAETTSAAATEALSDAAQAAAHSAKRAPAQLKAQTEGATDWVKENPIPTGLIALAMGAAVSSFFTAKSSTSRLDASKQLHDEARETPPKPAAKRSTKTKANTKAKAKASKSKTNAKKQLKPKPITTRVAKARNLKGKPDSAVKSATVAKSS